MTCHHGEFRRITPTQDREIARLAAADVPRAEIARLYGISKRQVYRCADRASQPAVEVAICGYRAWFELTELGPTQITGWKADPDAVIPDVHTVPSLSHFAPETARSAA